MTAPGSISLHSRQKQERGIKCGKTNEVLRVNQEIPDIDWRGALTGVTGSLLVNNFITSESFSSFSSAPSSSSSSDSDDDDDDEEKSSAGLHGILGVDCPERGINFPFDAIP